MCPTGKNSSHVPLESSGQQMTVHDQLNIFANGAASIYGCTSAILASIMVERLLLLVVG